MWIFSSSYLYYIGKRLEVKSSGKGFKAVESGKGDYRLKAKGERLKRSAVSL